jgi:putative ABC transport system ATP-binding protein
LSNTPRLELRNVSRTYQIDEQRIPALDHVSLIADAGTVTALLGRSGCGKSTLLNLAGAMDFPDSGDVLIDGQSTSGLNERELTKLRRHRIGFVFQSFQLLPTLSALENVELPLLIAGDRGASMPHQLSGGQMQRVAVARALAQRPEILIADEPTGNLDTASGDQVLELLAKAAREFGATVLLATHSVEAAAIANVRVRMRDGHIEAIEPAYVGAR